MPQFQHEGATIHYEVEGEGPPLLMIAGIASDSSSWAPLAELLAPRFRLIMPDNRGSGRTKFPGILNVGDIAGDYIALLDHLEMKTTAVLGHSLGGMIGQRIASLRPERVTRLVTLSCSSRIGDKERMLFKDMARLYARIEPQLWFRLLYQWLFASPVVYSEPAIKAMAEASTNYLHRQSPRDFALQVEAVDRMRPAVLQAIKCPVLAIAAERDILTPPKVVFAGHAGVARLETATIPNAGHSMHWEAPEAVAEAVARFLS